MKTIYFATRELARNFAQEKGGKFKDQGKDSPKGQRWSVLEMELQDLLNMPVLQRDPTPEEIALTEILNQNSVLDIEPVQEVNNALKFAMRKAELKAPESVTRRSSETLTDRKGNRVEVITRRRIAV